MESRGKKPAKPSGSQSDRIRTLSDLNRRSAPDSDSDSDGPQEHFTGGEKSGMLVQDPVEGPSENLRPSSSSRGDTVPSEPQQRENAIHYIVFWADGFTVDHGPLRKLDDPENASFLESIRNSECPKELEPADRRSPVHVNLISRDEEFPANEKPEKRLEIACQGVPFQGVPFQGVGRTIGSSSTSTVAEPPAASSLNTAPTPSPGLFVDENLPLASIRLRLADGTVMENARFNFHHTINDIHAYINAARPGGAKNYHLQLMGFPAKRLTDLSQTIEQAGLDKAVVIQKF